MIPTSDPLSTRSVHEDALLRLQEIHTPNNPSLKWSHDHVVSFDPVTHTYMRNGKQLKGVTTWIEQFKNKFDAEAKSKEIAERDGVDQVELLARWNKAGQDSRDAGHAVHEVFEHYSNCKEVRLSGQYAKEAVAVKFINDYYLTGRLLPVIAESLVYGESVASMRDQVAVDPRGDYYILDWKTNKEVKKNSYGKWMKPPFNFLPDVTFYNYSLQLRIYKTLSLDYNIKDCYIVHIGDTNYTIMRAHDIVIPKEIIL